VNEPKQDGIDLGPYLARLDDVVPLGVRGRVVEGRAS
jgi:hypothetical protein